MTFLHFILPDLGSNCLQMQSADDILPGLIWVQNIYKFNQQTTFLRGLFFDVIKRRYLVWPDLGLNCFNWNQQTTFCPTLSGIWSADGQRVFYGVESWRRVLERRIEVEWSGVRFWSGKKDYSAVVMCIWPSMTSLPVMNLNCLHLPSLHTLSHTNRIYQSCEPSAT